MTDEKFEEEVANHPLTKQKEVAEKNAAEDRKAALKQELKEEEEKSKEKEEKTTKDVKPKAQGRNKAEDAV